jgi:hypothetical protein
MILKKDPATFAFLALLAAILLALLVGPRIADSEQTANCVVNVRLPGPFGISLNCDSPEYLRLATEPSALFEPKNTRQSRPGLILVAALVALPLQPLSGLAERLGLAASRSNIDPQRITNALASFPPAFAAYMLLNVTILLLAFLCFRHISGCPRRLDFATGLIVVSIGLLLVSNRVLKEFAWSPSTQMFNILVPLVAIYVALRTWSPEPPPRMFVVAAGLITGFGMTAYAVFVILIPCFVLPMLIRSLLWHRGQMRVRLTEAVLFTVLSLAPFAIWYFLVRSVTGDFYHHDIKGKALWIGQVLSQEGVIATARRMIEHMRLLAGLAAWQSIGVAAALVWVLAVTVERLRSLAVLRPALPVIVIAIMVGALHLGFYASFGHLASRLAYSVVPPIIAITGTLACLAAPQLSPYARRVLALGLVLIAIVQIVAMIMAKPPNLIAHYGEPQVRIVA